MPASYVPPSLRQIEVFRAVMLAGGVTGAAKLLNVTQPGVSRTVQHLEQQLGVRLFDRRPGRLVPTTEANRLFENVQQLYSGVQGVQEFAFSLREGAHTSVRIACSPSLGLEVVPAAIAAMLHKVPRVRFELEVLSSPALVDSVVSGKADIGLCAAEVSHPALLQTKLASLRMVCVTPQGHPLLARRFATPRDAHEQPFVAFDAHTFQGRQVAAAVAREGFALQPLVRVRFARTACSLVSAGVGISFVDELTAAHAARGEVGRIALRPAVEIPVYLLLPEARPLSTHTEAFAAEAARALAAAIAHAALPRAAAVRGKAA